MELPTSLHPHPHAQVHDHPTARDPRLHILLLGIRAALIAMVRAIEVYCEIKRPAEFR